MKASDYVITDKGRDQLEKWDHMPWEAYTQSDRELRFGLEFFWSYYGAYGPPSPRIIEILGCQAVHTSY